MKSFNTVEGLTGQTERRLYLYVMKHRQERAQKLLEAVKDFVDIGQLCRVSIVLMKISSDFKAVEDARGHLQSQPAANVNRN